MVIRHNSREEVHAPLAAIELLGPSEKEILRFLKVGYDDRGLLEGARPELRDGRLVS